MDELTRLRTEAQTAGSEAGKLQESVPGLLRGLKSNLTSIFTKDNPMMAERENALQTFLNVPSQTRAELLPGNQPVIAGKALNYSPTAQEAMVTARQNAALVPLAGLNQSIVGQYGNLMDMLAQTGNIYQTQVQSAQNQAAVAQQAFQNALAQEQERRLAASAGGGAIDIEGALRRLGYGQDTGAGQRPPIESFETPDTTPAPQNIEIPGQGVVQAYTPPPISSPAGRWNPLAQLGAVGELFWNGLTGGSPGAAPVNPNTSLNILQANNDPNRISFAGR